MKQPKSDPNSNKAVKWRKLDNHYKNSKRLMKMESKVSLLQVIGILCKVTDESRIIGLVSAIAVAFRYWRL